MKLSEKRFVDLLLAFRSSEPTPGGGSASALSGAVGAALLAMVAGLPKPRLQEAADAARLSAAGARCGLLCERLAMLMDGDSEAYDYVVEAFRLPKGTAEEKAERGVRIQEGLRLATEAPLDVMRACASAITEALAVAACGNVNASSDVRVGLELLGAGLRGAKLNVDVNLASIKDEVFTTAVRAEADRLAASTKSVAAAALARLEQAN